MFGENARGAFMCISPHEIGKKIRRASGPRRVRSFATSFIHTLTHPHPHTHTQRSAFIAYLFRKKGAALGGIWAVNTIPILPPSSGVFTFRGQKKVSCFWTAFGTPNASKTPPKWPPKPVKKHRKSDAFLHPVFHTIFFRIFLVFAAVRPTISLLFTILSWGASFFEKLRKYQKNIPKKLPKS